MSSKLLQSCLQHMMSYNAQVTCGTTNDVRDPRRRARSPSEYFRSMPLKWFHQIAERSVSHGRARRGATYPRVMWRPHLLKSAPARGSSQVREELDTWNTKGERHNADNPCCCGTFSSMWHAESHEEVMLSDPWLPKLPKLVNTACDTPSFLPMLGIVAVREAALSTLESLGSVCNCPGWFIMTSGEMYA